MGRLHLHAALGAAAALGASGAREIVPFDFGWRFRFGIPPPACPADAFPLNYSGYHCMGLKAMQGATDPASCQAAACDQFAEVWQFCRTPGGCGSPTDCWVGSADDCEPNSHEWISFARNFTPPFDPAPANASYPDADWPVVDAPHDFLISQNYSATAYNGQASIPRNSSWYRKHFTLPADWQGSHVEVYFDGVFSVVQAFLNGVFVANHSCGYTSFAVRLDNVTGVRWGAENVLALYVDGTVTSGWWYGA